MSDPNSAVPPATPMPPPPPPSMIAPPPGYVPYGNASLGSGVFKPIGTLSKALVVLEIVALVISAFALGLQVALRSSARQYLDEVIDLQSFENDARAYNAISGLGSAIRLAAFVLLVIWSFRIAGNLIRLGRQQLTWKPGLTIVAWVLSPCTFGILAFFTLNEHWKASNPDHGPTDDSWTRDRSSPAVTTWFVLSVASILLGLVSALSLFAGFFRNSTNTDANAKVLAESVTNQLPLLVIAGLVALASRAALIVVIRQLAARHAAVIREA
ncbi:MAG: DUF4328 domain-containing protein [Ilumatobacteraceae bacterium]|jgi:hypothetical protein